MMGVEGQRCAPGAVYDCAQAGLARYRYGCCVAVAVALGVLLSGLAHTPAVYGLNKYFAHTRPSAEVFESKYGGRVEHVAVLPFDGATESIGKGVSDLFVRELLKTGKYGIIKRAAVLQVIEASFGAMMGLTEQEALQVAREVGADGVIIGAVRQYRTVPYFGSVYAEVGIAVRMVDCTSGRTVWAAEQLLRAESIKTTLHQQAQVVVHDLAAGLYYEWARRDGHPRDGSSAYVPSQAPLQGIGGDPVSSVHELPPELPAGVAVSDLGLREVHISWKAPEDRPRKFVLLRAASPLGPFEEIASVRPSRLRYTDRGASGRPLEDNSVYYYRQWPCRSRGYAVRTRGCWRV